MESPVEALVSARFSAQAWNEALMAHVEFHDYGRHAKHEVTEFVDSCATAAGHYAWNASQVEVR